jgi:3-deoxy-manno-octulosonate cytidylyltransferase (CMP-KDO synthetase)
MRPEVVAVIPARFGSTRLPGKPLATIGGVPLVVRVLRRVASCPGIGRILVATDDLRVVRAVETGGGEAVLTRADHPSGTDRIAEVASACPGCALLNVQGDEPGIDPGDLASLLSWLDDGEGEVGTLVAPIKAAAEFLDPAVVKVVVDDRMRALLFSRAPIPWPREWGPAGSSPPRRSPLPGGLLRHLGVYLYRPGVVGRLAALPEGRSERLEKLEQLRWLEGGVSVGCRIARHPSRGIDTPADLMRARRAYAKGLYP